jgi:hypothetical protein
MEAAHDGFSAKGNVLTPRDAAELFDGDGKIHNKVEYCRPAGTKAVQEKSWINEPAVADPFQIC